MSASDAIKTDAVILSALVLQMHWYREQKSKLKYIFAFDYYKNDGIIFNWNILKFVNGNQEYVVVKCVGCSYFVADVSNQMDSGIEWSHLHKLCNGRN